MGLTTPVLCSLSQGTCSPFLLVNISRYLYVPPFMQELALQGVTLKSTHPVAWGQEVYLEEPF